MEVSTDSLKYKYYNLIFERIVLVPASHHVPPTYYFAEGRIRFTLLRLLVGSVSLAIDGVLTRFKAGNSTHAQRIWTMAWLAFGIFGGSGISLFVRYKMFVFFYGAVAIGGLVVVCQMLLQYGTCIQIY